MQDKYTPNWKKQKIFFRIAIAVILLFGVAIYVTKMDSNSPSKQELNTPPPAQQFETPAPQPEAQPEAATPSEEPQTEPPQNQESQEQPAPSTN